MSSTMSTPIKRGLVSVIIATYNRSQLLRQTVDSVLAQTYPHIELIVVDDGSPDDTPEVMANYGDRVISVRQENQGASEACNNGFALSSGEYITYIDHDDLMAPTKIERQVQVLEQQREVDLVHCGFSYIDENGAPFQSWCLLPDHDIAHQLVLSNFLWSGGPLIRRACLEQVGLYDPEIWGSDWDLWLRIALAGHRFACVQAPLGAYRILRTSQMSNVPALEHGVLLTLDKAFASPGRAAIAPYRDEAYGRAHLQISAWHYAAGAWADAQRNLAAALALRPGWLADPAALARRLVDEAFGLRVNDPLSYIDGIFAHLPAEATALAGHHAYAQALTRIGLALRLYSEASLAAARAQIVAAISAYPPIVSQHEVFAQLLVQEAMKLPRGDPARFVDTILRNLPPQARPLQRASARARSDIQIARAFQDYGSEQYAATIQRTLRGALYRPAVFANRGVVAMLMRSVPRLISL